MTEDILAQNSSVPEWLSTALVQTALRNGVDPAITVVSYDVSIVHTTCKFASDIYRVTATLQDGQQYSVIVKCHAQAGLGSKLPQFFNKDVKMLTETLPELYSLLKDAHPEEFQPLGPECYHHGSKPVAFVVLEDVGEKDFDYPSRKYGLDFAHCSMALKTLARFHAASIVLHHQQPEKMAYYCKHDFLEKFRGAIEKFAVRGVSCLAEEVQSWPGYEEYSEKLLKLKESMCDRLAQTLQRKDGSLNALIHADAWAGNLMFRYSSGVVTDIRLTDFQSVVYGSPMIDLVHYLYASSNVHVQLYRTDELIKEYHSTLNETLTLLGYSQLSPSLEDFLKLYSQFIFYAFFISSTVFPLIVYNPSEETDDMGNVEGANLSPLKDSRPYKGKLYKCVMQYLLPFYEEKGIL